MIFFSSLSQVLAQDPQPGAPEVESIAPGGQAQMATQIGNFTVTFKKPVQGLKAKDLKVNGSAATAVSGAERGPYVFSGYLFPLPGVMKITLSPGDITDLQNGIPFAGSSWTIRLFAPDKDEDRDGLPNLIEIDAQSDPMVEDTDKDGMLDAVEYLQPCLKINVDDAREDPDEDGVSNLAELKRKTDACVSNP